MIKDEIKRRHDNDSSQLFASGQRDKFQWSIRTRRPKEYRAIYICIQWDLYKNENSATSARALHEQGGKRDYERVIWTCPRFGRAINSGRKLHPKGPNRSMYKTMIRSAYYALKM